MLYNPQNSILNLFRKQKINYLPKPTTSLTEVLHELIVNGSASIESFGYMCGFRTRISELSLKHNLTLQQEHLSRLNKFGNRYTYVNHILPKSEIENAIKLYNKLLKK